MTKPKFEKTGYQALKLTAGQVWLIHTAKKPDGRIAEVVETNTEARGQCFMFEIRKADGERKRMYPDGFGDSKFSGPFESIRKAESYRYDKREAEPHA